MQQTVVLDEDDTTNTSEIIRRLTPLRRRNDVHFPLSMSSPRQKRAPSIGCMTDLTEKEEPIKLTIRAKGVGNEGSTWSDQAPCPQRPVHRDPSASSKLSIYDLPLEVQGKVLDFIFGEVHSVSTPSTSLQKRKVSSVMRHPRRKAVSDLALVSEEWRELVQERIYRHIKIKGTKLGLAECAEHFCDHPHLTKYIRHVECWVPVWGDRTSLDSSFTSIDILGYPGRPGFNHINPHPHDNNYNLMAANDPTAIFKRSVNSATLFEIFDHIARFFTSARIFTLEGGHCKKSNMIRHFRDNILFSTKVLTVLPQIRTFAMRGAWNIMRNYENWHTIENALPNIEEWHCGYAKPRLEAYDTINAILSRFPGRLRHVNISLDGMYSKDSTTLSSTLSESAHLHLCDRLGRIAPQLESLTYTGKICSCFWSAAAKALATSHAHSVEPRLASLEVVVKSCCRQRVTTLDPETGEPIVDELGGIMADSAGIANLTFIRAFERLTHATVQNLDRFPKLENVRIRFIDIDSPCALLNPYFQLCKNRLAGLWNEEVLETLQETSRGRFGGLAYEELSEGIGDGWHKDGGVSGFYPKSKPKSIKGSIYRVLAEARGS